MEQTSLHIKHLFLHLVSLLPDRHFLPLFSIGRQPHVLMTNSVRHRIRHAGLE